ncbi:MAG: hypothetical protein IJ092_07565, partial [Atopobiaceae bacterium]|nr:hypothetical protein [Atopobiaceae bacterium]
AGNGAHTHNADCYDAYGNLVCSLPEKPFHTHTADCYATERVLTCALPETAGHAHTDACYDEDGNLTCTIPEEPAHTHTDACYETRRTDQLICGMEETTEEHVHGPACFETVTVELPDPEPETDPATATPAEPEATVPSTPEEDPTPAQEFSDVLKKKDQDGNEYVYLVVQVKAPQGALPKGSTMAVAHVDLNKKDDLTGLTAQEKLDDVLRKEAGDEAAFVQTDAVDITFKDAQGNRVDPAKKVEVRITTSMIRTFSDQRTAGDEAVANNSLLVLHVVDHQQTKRTDAPNAELIRKAYLVNQDEKDTSTGHEDTILFEAQEFSAYVVARVNNAANAPEDELEEEAQQTETEQQATTEASLEENAEATEEATSKTPAQTFSHSFSKSDGQTLMTVNVFAPEGAFPLGTTMQVKWVDAKQVEGAVAQAVSERTDGKLVDLRAVDITFTDSDGQEIEPAVPITVTFASDLIDTADDSHVVHIDDQGNAEVIDALGAKELQSRDIADQADELVIESDQFSTYVVAVTTLHKELTASDGSTYDIRVDAPAEAGIPQDAELQVREITPGGAGYDDYLYQAMSALGEDPSQAHSELARFFDIKIMSNGEEVHPQEAVKVSIQLADAPDLGEAVSSNAVHFQYSSEVKPQVLDATQEGDTTTFDANGFSVYGVIYTVDFHYEFNGQMYSYGIEGGDTVSLRELLVALNVVEPQDAQKFVSYISNVTFSNPELVAVAKVDENTTSGALKEALGVTTQYSAQLRAEERDQMDARQLTAPDWALITLKAFDTTESLTITLANGDSVTIAVTDAQITKHFLSQDGTGYNITLNYEDDAQIPADADLFVREIEPGTTEYQSYLAQSVDQLDVESVRDISYARFFDIEIQDAHQNKVEPKAPVLVSIELDDGADIEAAKDLHVVHYADDGTEVLEGIGVNQDGTVMTYLQNGFSVTGTVVTRPAANEQYMVLIDYNGSYYIVNNDGSLTNVGTSATGTVEVDEPMMWTYDGRNIYHHTEQVSFNMNQLAADFYNKYIDPTDRADAISTDRDNPGTTLRNINETYFDWNTWSNQTFTYQVIQNRPQQNVTQITLTNEHIKSANSNQYVGVVEDPDGTLRLVGGVSEANAATVRLAAANEVLKTNYLNHTVNHIDISIEGEAAVDVPLAYGSYYDANGNEVKTVTSPESLHLDSGVVGITLDDMKRAVITAYTKDADGTTHELDNAFVVNGYSANESTEFSTQQVRIEGEFRVSTIDPVSKQYYDQHKQQVYQDRLNNKIYYKVTAYKTITYNLIDPELGQLYDEFGNPMTVNVDVAFSASFDYWDPRNECPPVRWDSGEWSRGGIPDHNLSGMDFVLGGNSEGDAESRAVEIKKIIEDENGSPIAIQTSLDHSFMLHYYKDETDQVTGPGNANNLRNSDAIWKMDSDAYKNYDPRTDVAHKFVDAQNVRVRVGTSGVGQSYTYDFNSGMFYITEDTSTVPDEITGADGDTWYYESTVIETEYVRRYGGFDTTPEGAKNSHKSETYVDKTQNYDSRAEVLGRYNNAPNAQGVPSYDQNPDNEFLEFTVHNVYRKSKSETTELNVTKSWANDAPGDVTEVYVKVFRKIEGGNPEDVTELIKADKDDLSLYVTRANFDVDNAWIVVHKNDDNTWENVKVKSMPIDDNDGNHYTFYIEEGGYKPGSTVHRS